MKLMGKLIRCFFLVAPLTGAWIETIIVRLLPELLLGRAPHGRVD